MGRKRQTPVVDELERRAFGARGPELDETFDRLREFERNQRRPWLFQNGQGEWIRWLAALAIGALTVWGTLQSRVAVLETRVSNNTTRQDSAASSTDQRLAALELRMGEVARDVDAVLFYIRQEPTR